MNCDSRNPKDWSKGFVKIYPFPPRSYLVMPAFSWVKARYCVRNPAAAAHASKVCLKSPCKDV